MKEQYIYTIIIPHHNIPNLLKRCLWSIPRRDDTQIIVVDDKSNDENVLKLKKIAEDYPYVTFIYSDVNGGGGRARNMGLRYAKGEYVLFADADDFFNYCIHDVLNKYKGETCDVVFFNARYIDTDTYLETNRYPSVNVLIRKYEKNQNPDELKYMFGEPWCKLVRRELIAKYKIRFDETFIHNDTTFSYMVGFHSKTVKVDAIGLYCLADRPQSVSKDISDQKLHVRARVFSKKNRFLKDNNIHFFDNLMLSPFETFILKRDTKNLRICYDIAAEYGFSKSYVLLKLLNYECKRVVNKLKKIVVIKI